MKRIIAFCLFLLIFGSFVFADDAKVMPMMVGRIYIAPTYGFALGEYDTDGNYHKYSKTVQLFNLGFAIEYGVINWITAAVQWVPGWTPWSDVTGALDSTVDKAKLYGIPLNPDGNSNGVADLFVGAKIQIVGEKAPVQTSMFRAAIAPGVLIPLPGANFDDAATKLLAGSSVTVKNMDRHVFGAGARLYFDWIVNDHFYLNLYNETLFFPVKKDLAKHGPELAMMKGMLSMSPLGSSPMGGAISSLGGDVNYKYQTTFEIEPVFTTPLAEGFVFSAGLPINYKYVPAPDYSLNSSFTMLDGLGANATTIFKGFLNTDPQHVLSLRPNVSLFITKLFLPLEFKFQYGLPVWGKNVPGSHTMTLQIRAYFALPGRPE